MKHKILQVIGFLDHASIDLFRATTFYDKKDIDEKHIVTRQELRVKLDNLKQGISNFQKKLEE